MSARQAQLLRSPRVAILRGIEPAQAVAISQIGDLARPLVGCRLRPA